MVTSLIRLGGRAAMTTALGVGLMLCGLGCASGPGQIRLSPGRGGDVLVQDFTQSYMTRDGQGDAHIVLVADPLARRSAPAPDEQPLQPARAQPLRQVVHIHVLWKPLAGIALDNPSATNATIDWYIVAEGSRRGHDLVHYQGAGFIVLSNSGNRVNLQIRNATMKPAEVRGAMSDPIGATTLSGKAVAQRDPRRVREVLADVEAMVRSSAEARAMSDVLP
jgi:hypothetical protein